MACGIYELLPTTSHQVSKALTLMATRSGKQRPVVSGASFDLWKVGNEDGHIFAVKRLRVYESDDVRHMKKVIQIDDSLCNCFLLESLSQKFCKRLVTCKRIRHENILSIEGVANGPFDSSLVSKWMDNGNMLQYTKTNPQADRVRLVSSPVVHGFEEPFSSRATSCSGSCAVLTISTQVE